MDRSDKETGCLAANYVRMWIIDGHEDLAWNATDLGRELTLPVSDIRAAEGPCPPHGEGTATVSLPALRAADVRVVFATIFIVPYADTPARSEGYQTPEEAYRQAVVQVRYYQQLEAMAQATIIRTQADLEGVIEGTRPRPGLVLLLEGADPLRTPDDLAQFADWGVRIVGPAWGATRYAGGAGAPGPLTALGRDLMREMARLGIALDPSHLAEAAFWEALDLFDGPVLASHANCRAVVPTDRQLGDEMIRAIGDRDGVIGLVFYNAFIRRGWTTAQGKAAVSLADLLPHADHIARLIGANHIALGTDIDGGVGRELLPRELDTVEDLRRLIGVFREGGYDERSVAGILHGNWRRLLARILR